MDSGEELSYAFLEAHPADAARVLERLSPDAAAALLQMAPLRLSSPVLREMLPITSARCLEKMDDDRVVGLLRGVGMQAGVALLRQFEAARRSRLLTQLPSALGLAYELLLGYPEGTVGAWMNPHAMALPADMSSGNSLERIRESDETSVATPYVIDQGQHLLGYVELADLLRATPSTPIRRLMRPNTHRLPAQSRLAGLQGHPGWREFSALPVVDRGDRFVGVLAYAAMQQALASAASPPVQNDAESVVVGAAGAYWFGVSTLIQAIINQLPDNSRKAGS